MKYPYSSYNTPLPGYGTSLVDRINLYLHFRRYFKLVGERWLLLVICAAAGLGLGFWIAYNKPDVYQAKSVLQLPTRIVAPNRGPRFEDDVQKFTDTQLALMESGPVMGRVMAKLQEGNQNTNKLAKPEVVKAGAGRGSTFILMVESTNQSYAQNFASVWAEEFIAYKKQQRSVAIGSSEASTQRQIIDRERELNQDRDALAEFQRTHNITSIKDAGLADNDLLQRNKEILQALENQISLFENATKEQIATGAVDKKSNEARPTKVSNPATAKDEDEESAVVRFDGVSQYSQLMLELSRTEARREQHARDLKEKHPIIVQLDREIELRKKDIQQSLVMAENYRNSRLAALRVEAKAYKPLIEQQSEKVFEFTSTAQAYERLLNQEKTTKIELERLNQQLREVTIMMSDEDVFSVLDANAGDTSRPVRPKRVYIVLSGFIIGTLVGVGILFLLNRLDDRLETPEDIEEQLEEPILGQLPEVEKKHYKEGYLLLTRMKTHTMFAESLRGVRSALLLSPEGTSKRMLAVTSAVPGDGKTTFTTNFAVTLAHAGNRTLLIDADLRRGNIHGYFEQPLESGFSEVLQGKMSIKEAIRETGIQNLYFMRAGERPANPSELLIGSGTKDLIMQLRQEFDYVVFDCPPLTAIDDTFSIAAYLDGLFFVVRAGRTSIRFARMGLNTVRQRGAPILGLIVNGVPIDNPYYYYTTYYYASYYHRPLATGESMYQDRQRKPVEIELPPAREKDRRIETKSDGNHLD